MNTRSLRRIAALGVVSALATASVSVVASSAQAATPAPTRTTLTAAPATLVPGQLTTLKAVVKPVTGSAVPTGTVTFNEGATVLGTGTLALANGVAVVKVKVKVTASGSHSFTATYGGSAAFATSTSLTTLVTVTKSNSTTTITATATTTPGKVKLNATVKLVLPSTGIATGTVTYVVDGGAPQIIALNTFGKAPLTVTFIAGTSHTVTAAYSGSSTVSASNGSLTFVA
jgi:hypothetical protein